MVTKVPQVTNWSVTPQNEQVNYFTLMNTWLFESTTVINSLKKAIDKMNEAGEDINNIGQNAINAITFDNIAQLRLNSNMGRVAILGYYTKGDGGGGTFYWDSTSTELDNGGTIIQATGIATGRWKRVFSGIIKAKYFGAKGDGVIDDTLAIQNALDSFGVHKKGDIDLSTYKYRITTSLLIRRGKSLIGEPSSEIIADFSSGLWNDDYVALKYIVDESPTAVGVMDNTSQYSYGFTLTGINNSTIVSYGMKFYTSFLIDVGAAVTYSFLFGKISNVSIKRFDTAVYMREVNSSSYNNLYITECRRGVYVSGKSVNVVINNIYIANPTNNFTSSTSVTRGFEIESSTHYKGAVEGRPEGFSFNGGAIMSHFNNLYLKSCLSLNFENVMLDLATGNSVEIISVNLLKISGSYIFTFGEGYSCVNFLPVSVGGNQNVIIESNYIIGSAINTIGVNFPHGGNPRTNISVNNNKFVNTTGINAVECPMYSNFCNNSSETHLGTEFMYIQNAGDYTKIDGNTCTTSNVRMLRTHPVVTSKNLIIGDNSSPTYKTSYSGYVKLLAGQTTVQVPTYLGVATDYIRSIGNFTGQGSIGKHYFTPFTNGTNGTLKVDTPAAADTLISYTIKAVPYTATII